MFGFFKPFTKQTAPEFFLTRTDNDKWAVARKQGREEATLFTYTRKRDAIRGAQRRGILLQNV